MFRPEIDLEIFEISIRIKEATITDIKTIKKVAKFIRPTSNSIVFPAFDRRSMSVRMFECASNNLPNGESQVGFIMFLRDKDKKSCPLKVTSATKVFFAIKQPLRSN